MLSQSSTEAFTSDASPSIVDDAPDPGLLWEPKTVCGKGTTDRYWVVENTRRCADFCKNQLKVNVSIFITNTRTPRRDSCGHLKPRKLQKHGPNSTKLFIVANSLLMSFANIAEAIFNTQIALPRKPHQQWHATWTTAACTNSMFANKQAMMGLHPTTIWI
jgi:hypothetical protein